MCYLQVIYELIEGYKGDFVSVRLKKPSSFPARLYRVLETEVTHGAGDLVEHAGSISLMNLDHLQVAICKMSMQLGPITCEVAKGTLHGT
jgi:hypothetical protein